MSWNTTPGYVTPFLVRSAVERGHCPEQSGVHYQDPGPGTEIHALVGDWGLNWGVSRYSFLKAFLLKKQSLNVPLMWCPLPSQDPSHDPSNKSFQQGADMKQFLTHQALSDLYNTMTKKQTIGKRLLKYAEDNSVS